MATYPEFILRAPLQALYSTGQVFSSVLWMKVCSLWVARVLLSHESSVYTSIKAQFWGLGAINAALAGYSNLMNLRIQN